MEAVLALTVKADEGVRGTAAANNRQERGSEVQRIRRASRDGTTRCDQGETRRTSKRPKERGPRRNGTASGNGDQAAGALRQCEPTFRLGLKSRANFLRPATPLSAPSILPLSSLAAWPTEIAPDFLTSTCRIQRTRSGVLHSGGLRTEGLPRWPLA